MKKILALCAAVLAGGSVYAYRATRLPNKFGDFEGAKHVSVAELVSRPKDFAKTQVAVEGHVTKQCTSMGCYFFFVEPGGELRVDLQEIAMTAPRKEGHRARVEGRMQPYADGWQLSATAVEFLP